VPKVRINEDTLWYDRFHPRGEEIVLEGSEYIDLLAAGRLDAPVKPETVHQPALEPHVIEGCHKGEIIFVLGNGPSLELAKKCKRQLEALTAIGVNRSFRLLKTKYLLFLDGPLWVTDSEQILQCGSTVFCPQRLRLPYFTPFARYSARNREDVLSQEWSSGLYWSRSSAVAAINLAYIFGAAEIALLGVDLRDYTHFYSGKGSNRSFPHADKIIEDLWWMSRRLLDKGIKLWNCSPDSAVRGFEKTELGALLERR